MNARRGFGAAVLCLAGFFLPACTGFQATGYPDHTVKAVDPDRYAGKWYEIASFPTWFQRGCICSTAEYINRGDYVEVINTCRKESPEGELDVASGKAFPSPGTQNSQLKVRFQWPFTGDYWIIELDPGYRYAVVGHPKKTYLWILSRTPRMEEELYQDLVERAEGMGYDVGRLRRTPQICTEP